VPSPPRPSRAIGPRPAGEPKKPAEPKRTSKGSKRSARSRRAAATVRSPVPDVAKELERHVDSLGRDPAEMGGPPLPLPAIDPHPKALRTSSGISMAMKRRAIPLSLHDADRRSLATFRLKPAPSTTATTSETSLYASGISSRASASRSRGRRPPAPRDPSRWPFPSTPSWRPSGS